MGTTTTTTTTNREPLEGRCACCGWDGGLKWGVCQSHGKEGYVCSTCRGVASRSYSVTNDDWDGRRTTDRPVAGYVDLGPWPVRRQPERKRLRWVNGQLTYVNR